MRELSFYAPNSNSLCITPNRGNSYRPVSGYEEEVREALLGDMRSIKEKSLNISSHLHTNLTAFLESSRYSPSLQGFFSFMNRKIC